MKIIAVSINSDIKPFIHSGYMSAYPRSYIPYKMLLPSDSELKVININESVALKNKVDEKELTLENELPHSSGFVKDILQPVFTGGYINYLFLPLLMFLWITGIRINRVLEKGIKGKLILLCAAVLTMAYIVKYDDIDYLISLKAENSFFIPEEVPWKNVKTHEYKDPVAATEVIVKCIVANAVASKRGVVSDMRAIYNKIGLPLSGKNQTPGMKYALITYGLDGWGREIKLSGNQKKGFEVRSAGPDGVFNNSDDITAFVDKWDDGWESRISGIYVRYVNGEIIGFINSLSHPLFVKRNSKKAFSVTGSDLYDLIHLNENDINKYFGANLEESPLFKELDKKKDIKQENSLWYFLQMSANRQ